ncbi:right-handed parallel beta-helix repeat-containing protein [Paracraurococcus lichenis]|uniref:Right-handed parallel beta-helix repeat-containing protein n=1 Tax=Paracraurococcus lichenis TaxID=3064888 RepID=A0ABT9DZR1_9PROT|nr:right-handed parallel beta-helix repeat-containing protein [Paracraurococcus sp. LOR1-02]MDO9709368.1 right-handed parallel beta-helix repeat-containing protein [Paracraurococcus sp. LOR1-02]
MTVLTVGAGQSYKTIAAAVAAAHDGDVVKVAAGTYTNDFVTVNASITLQAVGGMVNMVATASPPDGKAIMTVNKSLTIDGFAFSGAKVADHNGAGIRYQGGDLVIRNCYFHDNQEGILAASNPSGHITIDHSEFARNGYGDGYTHNLYVNKIASLTITDSYFHDAIVGHEIKSRADVTTITNTRIFDLGSTASYSVDLPNGGKAVMANNTIQQGASSQNPYIVHFGGEGTPYAGSSLTMTNNMVLNDLHSGSAKLLLNQSGYTPVLQNTKVFGLDAGHLATGTASIAGTSFLASEPALDTRSPFHPGVGYVDLGTAANQHLTASAAPDYFIFRGGSLGHDSIAGFSYAGGDRLDLTGLLGNVSHSVATLEQKGYLAVVQNGSAAEVQIDLAGNHHFTVLVDLAGLRASQLPSDFLLV